MSQGAAAANQSAVTLTTLEGFNTQVRQGMRLNQAAAYHQFVLMDYAVQEATAATMDSQNTS